MILTKKNVVHFIPLLKILLIIRKTRKNVRILQLISLSTLVFRAINHSIIEPIRKERLFLIKKL